MTEHLAVRIARFGRVTDRSEMRWYPFCRNVGTYPTIPPEDDDGDLDESVYDCDTCGRRTQVYHPEIEHDRCRGCGSYIARGLDFCDTCKEAEDCANGNCTRPAPHGDYCDPYCAQEAQNTP